jgi:hypothetical protein
MPECFQTHYKPVRRRSLGTQCRHLKEVRIDIFAMFHLTDPFGSELELLPLLRIFWEHGSTPCIITFVRTGSHLDSLREQQDYGQEEGTDA